MKLRAKITLSSIALLFLAIALCCVLILNFVWSQAINDAVLAAEQDMQEFCLALRTNSLSLPADESIESSYILSAFRMTEGSSEYTLSRHGNYISNNTGFSPEALLDLSLIHI